MTLWDHEKTVESFGIEVPPWIDSDISCYDVAAISQGGCASGAYMPAVTYYHAAQTMAKHGDDVIEYIWNDHGSTVDFDSESDSWSGFACKVLSIAVELWAMTVEYEILELLEEND